MSSNRLNVFETLSTLAGAIATLAVVVFVVGFFTGTPIVVAVFGNAYMAAGWAGLLAVVAYIGYYSDEFSIGFGLTAVALLLLLSNYLPSWTTRPFAPLTEVLFGTQLGSQVDPVHFAVLTTAVVILYWAFDIRLFGRGKKPSTVAERVRIRFQTLVREYANITRVTFAFVFSALAIALAQAGELGTEAASLMADAPVVVSNLLTAVGGYFALGGSLPDELAWIPGLPGLVAWIGGIGPAQFFLVTVVLLAIAFGSREQLADFNQKIEKERRKRREAENDD